MKKTYVLDTNVLLHDPEAILKFEDNDIVIPILVLEELDRFKKGNEWINQNARSFSRMLSRLSDQSNSNLIIPLGSGKGNLTIPIEIHNTTLLTNSVDNQLLALCQSLKKDSSVSSVIFVTKDINLRMKARALDIESEDYDTTYIKDPAKISPGYKVITKVSSEIIDKLHEEPSITLDSLDSLDIIEKPDCNEYIILKSGKQSVITFYNKDKNTLQKIQEQTVSGIRPKNLEQILAIDLLLNPDIPLVVLTGISGTGKTLLGLAAAIEQKRRYLQIFLTRPVVPLGNDIGFLPGDIKEKLDPYMQPLYDNIEVIKKSSKTATTDDLFTKEKIKIIALPYLRGRSLPKIFFQVDEAQNLSPHEVKTIVTRVGEGSKIVFTGDINQIDSPYLDIRSNGMSHLIHRMSGNPLFGHIRLNKGERSKLAEVASQLL